MESRSLEHGRNLAEWCQSGPHRCGDLYVAAIYFFVIHDGDALLEGWRHLRAALSQAKKEGGCGCHVVPPRDEADRQFDAITRNIFRLPNALKAFAATGVDPADPRQKGKAENCMWLSFEMMGISPDDATVLTEYFLLGPRTLRKAIFLYYNWKPDPPAAE